jgi:uncharacterized protein (DUF2141 family)
MVRTMRKNAARLLAAAIITAMVGAIAPIPSQALGIAPQQNQGKAQTNTHNIPQNIASGPEKVVAGASKASQPATQAAAKAAIKKYLKKNPTLRAQAKNLGAPKVDFTVPSIPYTDKRTIDANTHKVKISADGYDEVLEVRGYVCKAWLQKGKLYSAASEGASMDEDVFYPVVVPIDGNSNIADVEDDDGDEFYKPRKSGFQCFLVLDLLELLLPGSAKGGEYTFTLNKVYKLSGTIKNAKGKPIRNARVDLFTSKARSPFYSDYTATTDKKGRYAFYGVSAGKYRLRASVRYGDYAKPKYGFEYYNNRHSLRTAKAITMPKGKSKSGVSMRLSAYSPPKADKTITGLPFKAKSRLTAKSREIQDGGSIYKAKVYSVKLVQGRTYEIVLNGKGLDSPIANIIDSEGYCAVWYKPEMDDLGIAAGTFTPHKTDTYRIEVYNQPGVDGYDGGYASLLEFGGNGKFSLSVSEAFTSGGISGKVTRGGGYGYEDVLVEAYKKQGKRWVSYMYGWADANGEYNIKGLKPGEYKIAFFKNYDGGGRGKPDRYYKEGKSKGTAKKSKATIVKVTTSTTRNIDIKL